MASRRKRRQDDQPLVKIAPPLPWPSPPLPRRGRPEKPQAERLSIALSVRVTESTADAMYRYAIKHGEPLDTVLRTILMRFLQSA